jgi:transcriptional regulator with XRE-family HTH domain
METLLRLAYTLLYHQISQDSILVIEMKGAYSMTNINLAEHLQAISGLSIEHLAEIFGVSRTTYHKWLAGSPLHDTHREHLLEVLPLVEEASQRLGSPSALSAWLLTPVTPGGKKPIEYLSTRQYDIFRGFLLRGIDQNLLHPPTPLKFVYRERPYQQRADILRQLHPNLLLEDYPDDEM